MTLKLGDIRQGGRSHFCGHPLWPLSEREDITLRPDAGNQDAE